MKYKKLREEEIKNKVEQDFFNKFDCTEIIKDVDFAVRIKRLPNTLDFHNDYLLWAEAKKDVSDVTTMLAQLVLTIGKARTFNENLPPPFLGCFDCEKIAFVHYHEFLEIFHKNDFNWNVTPSNRETREFKLITEKISKLDENNIFIFDFEKDEKELEKFIKENFIVGKMETSKIRIDKNNFTHVYYKWLEMVKPSIDVDWEIVKKHGIIDGDFYLADLLSRENKSLKEKLLVILETNKYRMDKCINEMGLISSMEVNFSDNQKKHAQFWAIYERPPKEEYWDYIIDRHDLLVPQDIRERKGSFYTPKIWVELSQKYIADVFGENWQDEYYIWDCAAGTGNLLFGLTNKYNIYASTIDKSDVDIMHQMIESGGANLLEKHCFQFDFLNDDFKKLPQKLQEIIEKTPEKLIIYINPPYLETNAKKLSKKDSKGNKTGIQKTEVYNKYEEKLFSTAKRELFVQFLTRIYFEIQRCKIANFATLKPLCAPNFVSFREFFQAKLEKLFVIPADTFDNVDGDFPIGFHIWDTDKKEKFKKIKSNIFVEFKGKTKFIGRKNFYSYEGIKLLSGWNINELCTGENIGYIPYVGSDFQHQNIVSIINSKDNLQNKNGVQITNRNLMNACIFFAVRKVIPATWLNDRDQLLYPNKKWEKDKEFQNDCLTFTLFHGSNNISIKYGVNHWIPFFESEVNTSEKYESHFLLSFISGKVIQNKYSNLFEQQEDKMGVKLEFSSEATAVFDAGRELWKYYHSFSSQKLPSFGGAWVVNVNASFYDIREYFQGINDAGRMNSKSEDEKYTELLENLRKKMKILAKKIEPKIYEYEFLKE
ncbi:MAG: hypothetical protein FWF51_08135 [Chitinivibrionia bacterium]|nr:hypothetical protein [Chitinivibrionia bacterium]